MVVRLSMISTAITMKVGSFIGSCLLVFTGILIECYPEKRFLIETTSDKQRLFCFPPISYCHLQCTNGYLNSPKGCPICQCQSRTQDMAASSMSSTDMAASSMSSTSMAASSMSYRPQAPQSFVPNSLTSGSLTSGYNMFNNPCQPQQMFCSLTCPHGFLTGNNGCHFCFCASAPQGTKAPPTTTSGPLVILKNPCVASQHRCGLHCNYGYLKGPSNCDYCLCAPPGLVIAVNSTGTSLATTSTPQPTSPTPTGIVLPDPCVPSQSPCAMTCTNGFVKGPHDCQYCLCAPSTVAITTTTSNPAARPAHVKPTLSHDSHRNSSVTSLPMPSTVSPDVANECIIATTICQLKCSSGFMTDPLHCTFCVCKDEMYNKTGIPKSEEPTILLQNPCVEGMDTCRIFCMAGYLRGPNDCQYCACRH